MTAFEKFFDAWLKKLGTVQIPEDQMHGAEHASWDRKAAWMMFKTFNRLREAERLITELDQHEGAEGWSEYLREDLKKFHETSRPPVAG